MAAGSRGKEDSVTKKGRPGKAEKEGTLVLLTITGRQTDPDTGTQENTASYRAVMSACGEGHLFSYLTEDASVKLFVSRERAWMQRGGKRENCMVFDPSVTSTQCDYETAYGVIPMEIRTDRISVLAGGSRGLQARIRYTLAMSPEYELTCSVTIKTQQTV
jgi:hypothetical protein